MRPDDGEVNIPACSLYSPCSKSEATGKHRLVDSDLDPAVIRGANLMGFVYTLVMLPSIGFSFIKPIVSFYIYIFLVVAFIISTALGRGEIAMTLPVASKQKKE
jgi:hypothetical protein